MATRDTLRATVLCAFLANCTAIRELPPLADGATSDVSDGADASDVTDVTDATDAADAREAAVDTGVDVQAAENVDVVTDTGVDAPADTAPDTAPDVVTDTGIDVAMDVPRDVAMDVPVDVATDVGTDTADVIVDVACGAGLTRCGGECVNLTSSASNCGACGTVCATPTGTTANACSGGVCVPVCATNYRDCDSSRVNGCELNTVTLTSCNGCGTSCARANAVPTCSTGTCAISSCNEGFGNCDGLDSNGCETATRASVINCGTCGHACGSGQMCMGGLCCLNLGGGCSGDPDCCSGRCNGLTHFCL